MNEEYRFLETIANFLEQGYLIQDVLNICKYIYNNRVNTFCIPPTSSRRSNEILASPYFHTFYWIV